MSNDVTPYNEILAGLIARDNGKSDSLVPEAPEDTDEQEEDDLDVEAADNEEEEAPTDPFESVTLEQLRQHPRLGAELKSYADREHAAQMRGREESIRRETREQVEMEYASRYFAGLSQDDLAEALATQPDLAVLYGRVKNKQAQEQATKLDPQRAAELINTYAVAIRTWVAKLGDSPLSPEVKAGLQPEKYLNDASLGDGEARFNKWTSAVTDALVEHELAAGRARRTRVAKAAETEESLLEDSRDERGPLSRGQRSASMPDFDTTSGSSYLAAALARSKTTRSRR